MRAKQFFLMMAIAISFSKSYSQSLKTEYDSSRIYIQKGNFEGALPWLEKAKMSAQATPADTNSYVEVIKLLAIANAKTGKGVIAEQYFKETMELYEKMPSKKGPFSSALQNFGVFYFNQKKYKEAISIFNKALEVRSELAGEKNAEYLVILNNVANCYSNLKQYPEAEKAYLKLIKLREETVGISHPDYLQAINSLAALYKAQGKNESAIALYQQILEGTKAAKGENSQEYASSCTNLANLYKSISKYDKAEEFYKKSHDVYLQVSGEKTIVYGVSIVNLAGIYRLSGKYELSEPLYIKSLNIFKELTGEISAEYASVLNNMALFYTEIGKYDQAESYYKQAIEVSRQTLGEKHPETNTTYSNLGLLYRNMGRYDQAEITLKKALKNRKEVLGEKHQDYAASLNNLAGLYESMGRPEEAEPLYNQSLAILKQTSGDKTPDYASTLNNLAGIYENSKRYEKAEPLYNQAVLLLKEIYGESHPDYLASLNNLAMLQEGMGKKESALKLYKQNIESTKISLGEKHPNYAIALNNYAVLLASLGNYGESEKMLLQVLTIRKEALNENHPAYTNTVYELAKVYAASKNFIKADQYWDMALSSYLHQIDNYFPSMSEREKGKFYQTISPRFEQYNSYALLRKNQNPAILSKMYNYQLATKALLLNASNKVRQRILNSGDFILIDKYKKWNLQKELLSKAEGMSKEEIKEQDIDIEELGNSTNELEKELSSLSELFREANENNNVTWQDVQKKLKPEEAAAEIIRFTKYRFDSTGCYSPDSVFYVALIITSTTKAHPDLIVMKNGNELEKQYLKYYRNSIKNKIEDEFGYAQYWSRLKNSLTGIKTLYLSPDGVYNIINLNTLKNVKTSRYVTDELDIQIVTNTKDLLSTTTAQVSEKTITLFGSPDFSYNTRNIASNTKGISAEEASFIERAGAGVLDPLPGTKAEVEKIAGMLSSTSWHADLYTEQNALEENIKKLSNPRVLHIATHGFFDQDDEKPKNNKKERIKEQNPLLKSGLMLAGASFTLLKRKNESANIHTTDKNKEDGILTAYEALNLNLDKTDLVVLSACETGLGEVKNGEGVYGLQRAFKVAGAKSIILSLWTVNDATTQKLMTSFYQEWIKTGSKRAGFKNAQAIVRKSFPEPYYWGAFVMIGE